MIARIEELLANNRAFITERLQLDPAYFDKLAEFHNGIVGAT
jgi:hypothetical protein